MTYSTLGHWLHEVVIIISKTYRYYTHTFKSSGKSKCVDVVVPLIVVVCTMNELMIHVSTTNLGNQFVNWVFSRFDGAEISWARNYEWSIRKIHYKFGAHRTQNLDLPITINWVGWGRYLEDYLQQNMISIICSLAYWVNDSLFQGK